MSTGDHEMVALLFLRLLQLRRLSNAREIAVLSLAIAYSSRNTVARDVPLASAMTGGSCPARREGSDRRSTARKAW